MYHQSSNGSCIFLLLIDDKNISSVFLVMNGVLYAHEYCKRICMRNIIL